jgi:SAM-dependent methyltransferase
MKSGKEKLSPVSLSTNYDTIAAEYGAYGEQETTTEILGFRNALPLFGRLKGRNIIDYGCGPGRFAGILKNIGARVVGVDISEKEIALAREKYKDIEFHSIRDGIGDLAGNFDAASLNFVTCTIPDEREIKKIFQHIHSLLREGGRLVMINPNFEEGPNREFMTESWGNYEKREGAPVSAHLRGIPETLQDFFWSKKFYMDALVEAGFRIEALLQPRAGAWDGSQDWKDERKHSPVFIVSAIAMK